MSFSNLALRNIKGAAIVVRLGARGTTYRQNVVAKRGSMKDVMFSQIQGTRIADIGCAISGVYDLTPLTLSFQRDPLGLTAAEVVKFSSLNHLPKKAGPMIMTVGGFETQEFVDQTLDYAKAWREAGLKEETIVVAQANHISILTDGYATHGAALHNAVLRQMGLAK